MKPMPVLVYKLGGASVRNAEALRNVLSLLEQRPQHHHLVLVVSAMGKTTNGLEALLRFSDAKDPACQRAWRQVYDFHADIVTSLFPEPELLLRKIDTLLTEALDWLEQRDRLDFDFLYDQVVSLGEQVSTLILADWLELNKIPVAWFDARQLIRTDANWREAKVNWAGTAHLVRRHIKPLFSRPKAPIVLTQGFIGATLEGKTTTLGREGSDYSAAILSYCLEAKCMTIWKDVQGVLNGDPKEFEAPELLPELSYQDAIEMAYFGATVIHPKTLQPLHDAGIPLEVKSFVEPEAPGTRVSTRTKSPAKPCYIVKRRQALLTMYQDDFRFATEGLLSEALQLLHEYRIKVHMVQNSALRIELCVEGESRRLDSLAEQALAKGWNFTMHKPMILITVYQAGDLKQEPKLRGMGQLRMEQRNANTWRLLFEEEV